MFHNKLIVFALLLLISHSMIQAAQINAKPELSAAVAADDVEKKTTTTTTTTTTIPPSTSTTAAPTTSTTTSKTTAPPDTSTTTSTTAVPDTTTTTSTTASPDTNTTTTTTTVAPTTTTLPPTTPAPTPTPTPTPYPEPSIGQWNSSCILVKMAAQLNMSYETKENGTSTALYNIPTNATYNDGQCPNDTQTIQINWGTNEAQNSMLLQFELKNQTARLTKLHFVISIIGDRFPNAMENQTISLLHLGDDFGVPLKMSYHCTRPQVFNLTETRVIEENEKKIIGTVTVHDVQIEAFRSPSNSTAFSEARDCDSSETPDIVPIAVGIALVAMIMIILVSYLCARRRSTSRGYMSF